MKIISIIMCSGLIIEALTGCLSGQPAQQVATKEVTETADDEYSIIGKWSGKDSDNTVHYEFKEDGTYISSKTNAKGEKSDEIKGTYSFSEDMITFKEKDDKTTEIEVLFDNEYVMIMVTKEKDEKDSKKTKTKELRLVKEVSKRNVSFTNDTGLNITEVRVKSEKDEDYSKNLAEDKDKEKKVLFSYSFDTSLKYEIQLKTKPKKSKVVAQNSKKDTEEGDTSEAKEIIIKDFNANDMSEAKLKIKNDKGYVEYVSLATGETKNTYVEPKKEEPKKEETKPAASSGQNIDTSMAGTYYLQGNMNVRTGPGYDAGVITVYSAGTAVSVAGTITNPDGSIWAKLSDGTYVCYRDGNGQYLGTSPPAGGGASGGTYVTLYEMNLRAGPSTSAASLGIMPAGTVFDASVIVTGSDGSIWACDPGQSPCVCIQNSGGTYCAPY